MPIDMNAKIAKITQLKHEVECKQQSIHELTGCVDSLRDTITKKDEYIEQLKSTVGATTANRDDWIKETDKERACNKQLKAQIVELMNMKQTEENRSIIKKDGDIVEIDLRDMPGNITINF
jgi:chromosome segregation ATPase